MRRAEVRCADGVVAGPHGSVTIAEIAKVAHLRMDGLPAGVDPLLDATATYEPAISTGVFSYATHGAVAPPAAIANAVRDALAAIGAPKGVEIDETPITPRRVMAAIGKAREGVAKP